MKLFIAALVVSLFPTFAQADTPVGKMTMKLGDEVTVNQAVLKKEIKAIETQIAEVSIEIDKLERDTNVFVPAIHPGLPNVRDGLKVLASGLDIERAQLMQRRRALLSESVTAVP